MTKKPTLELNPTESAPQADNFVTDGKGRTLKVQPPDVLTESRLIRLIGQEAALNSAYLGGYVFPAVSVVEIDGEPMGFPTSQREIDALIQMLGREGLSAVIEHLSPKKKEVDEQKDAVKN